MQYWDDSVDFFPSLFSLRQLLGTFLQSSHTHTCKLFTGSMINLRYPHSLTNKKDMVKWGLPVDSARWIGLGTTFQTLLIVDFVAFVKVKTVGAWADMAPEPRTRTRTENFFSNEIHTLFVSSSWRMSGVRLEFEFGNYCSRSSRTIVNLFEKFANSSRTVREHGLVTHKMNISGSYSSILCVTKGIALTQKCNIQKWLIITCWNYYVRYNNNIYTTRSHARHFLRV